MLINNIILFKSNLDVDYRNVFDGYTSISQYIDKLKWLYEYKNIFINNTKGIINNNGMMIINIPENSIDIRDYNYCIINNKYSFFITSHMSLNDSENPSTQIMLKWDAFSNNYLSFRAFRYDKNLIIRRTLHSFRSKDYDTDFMIPTEYTTNIINVCKKTKVPSSYLLYIAVRFKEVKEVNFLKSDGTYDWDLLDINEAYFVGAIPSQSSSPIIYIPYRYIQQDVDYTNIDVNKTINFGTYGYPLGVSNYNDVFKSIANDFVYEAWLTTYSPFSYRYDSNTNAVLCENGNTCKITIRNPDDDSIESRIYGWVAKDKDKLINIKSFTIDRPKLNIPNFDFGDNYSDDIDDMLNYEGGMYNYPHNYSSIVVDDIEIPLIFSHDQNSFTIDRDINSTSLNYRITKGMGDEKQFSTYNNHSRLITGNDSFLSYMNSNSQQQKSSTEMALLSNAISIGATGYMAHPVVGIAFGVAGALSAMASYNAKRVDADNMPDVVNIPSNISSNNIINEVDHIRRYINYIASRDDQLNTMYDMHYYGYEYGHLESVNINYRSIFDYVKTDNCMLQYIKNNNDREEIQNAYNNGITRWHIDAIDKQPTPLAKSSISSFNKNILNLDNDFIFSVG